MNARRAQLVLALAAGSHLAISLHATLADDQPETPAPANAQPQPHPAPSPKAPDDVEQRLRELETASARREPLYPSTQQGPAIERAQRSRLIREGTFLVDRRGRLARAASGEFAFAFDPDERDRADPPMALVPCQFLEGLASVAARAGDSATFRISGQVLAYQGRNFLLLTRPAEVMRSAPAPTEPAASTQNPSAAPPAPTPRGEAGAVIADLEASAPRPAPPTIAPLNVVAGETRAAAAYREGTFITSRRGRMTRSGRGWMLNFDNEPGAQADPPIQLLPCVNLMAMEDLAVRGVGGGAPTGALAPTDALSLAVSGRVFTFQGRSYLLPTMYIVQQRGSR